MQQLQGFHREIQTTFCSSQRQQASYLLASVNLLSPFGGKLYVASVGGKLYREIESSANSSNLTGIIQHLIEQIRSLSILLEFRVEETFVFPWLPTPLAM